MSKKYIQNCTGDECGEKKISKQEIAASLFISRIIFHILFVGFVAVSLYMLFFSANLQILNIQIVGADEIGSGAIKQKIESSLNEKYLGIVPKNNFLLVSHKKIETVLMEDFKKIRSVNVVKKFPDYISIDVDERKALLVWCSNDKCYLLDENGTAYSEADFNSQEFVQNNLLQINDASGRGVVIGERVVDSSYEKYALEMRNTLNKSGLELNGEYKTPSRMAEEIRIRTQQGPELYFSMHFSLESAIVALDTVLKKEIPTDKIGDVEYIDLRNENKVFYKFKNQEPENTQVEEPQAENTKIAT